MRIGIIYEDYHSEVVEFLLELLQFKYDLNITLYNNEDRYDNLDIYLKKYNRIQKRSIKYFVKDLANDVCNKYIVVTYGNLFSLNLVEDFSEKLIFIAHNENQLNQIEKLKLKYITLSSLLAKKGKEDWKYMLPICKDSEIKNNYNDVKFFEKPENEEIRRVKIIENKLKPIMVIGHFFKNNKDIELIKKLLDTKGIYLFIFTPNMSDELEELSKYASHIYCGINFKTKMIERLIEKYNIKHVLFAPPQDSAFFDSQWSGSIAFALNRNMTVVMPEELAKEYKIKEYSVTYKSILDINTNFVKSLVEKDVKPARLNIYKRNEIVMDLLLFSKHQNYKIENGCFTKEDVGLDNTDELIENINKGSSVMLINTPTARIALDLVKKNDIRNIIICNEDLEVCKMQKATIILHNYTEYIKIYNEKISNKGITIDSFECNLDIIIKEGDDIDEIKGKSKTISRDKPRIISINKETNDNVLDIEGYISKKQELVNTKLEKYEKKEWINIERKK